MEALKAIMRKCLWVLIPILLLLQMVQPICYVVTLYTGRVFQEYHPEVFASVTAALMLAGTVLAWRCKPVRSKWYDICCYFLLPCAIITGMLFFEQLSWYMTVIAGMNTACAVILFSHSAGRWKPTYGIFSGVVALWAVGLCGLGFIISLDAPRVAVIDEYPSPDGTYTAQVEVLDWEGRVDLEKEIRVELYDHSGDVELLIGKFRLDAKEIYSSGWSDHENLTVRWLGEDTLLIDEEIYYEVE